MSAPPSQLHATIHHLPVVAPPSFEGHPVQMARARLTAVTNLDVDSDFQIDDVVRVTVEGTVTAIGHNVDPVSGALIRVHTIRVYDTVNALPHDPNCGDDDE